MKDPFLKSVLKTIFIIGLCMVACRFTKGYFVGAICIFGAISALSRRIGLMIGAFVLIQFLVVANPVLVGVTKSMLLISKIMLPLYMLIATTVSIQNRRLEKVPIGWLGIYLFCVAFSSIDGWFPMISYLKIVNFALILVVLNFIVRIMQLSEHDLMQVRIVMVALAIIVIPGSLASRAFPSVAYSMTVDKMAIYGIYITGADVASAEGVKLFNGMLQHSQFLSPICGILLAWMLCDWILVVRRFSIAHCICVVSAPLLLYMTRSRTAIAIMAAVAMTLLFYGIPKAKLPIKVRRAVQTSFIIFCSIAVMVALVLEVKNQTMTRWLRKRDDTSSDNRSMMKAVTESRQELVDINMRDFKLNLFLGKGFQVMDWHREAYRAGAITLYSAPIEKGVLPLMILGEGGILGAFAFLVFLLIFYCQCMAKRYAATLTLFTAFLASNMSEATFFSPSGCGGIEWVIVIIGGMCVDILVINKSRMPRNRINYVG